MFLVVKYIQSENEETMSIKNIFITFHSNSSDDALYIHDSKNLFDGMMLV